MAKKKRGELWWLVGIVLGGLGLYYLQTGLGSENDSALIPDGLEGKIDRLIAALNNRFGHGWVSVAVDTLTYFARTQLPPPMVELVDVVTKIEMLSRRTPMTAAAKRQLAVQMKRTG